MKNEIIDYIRRNRVSTTEIADCLGKSGRYSNVLPVNRGHFKVGNIFWTYASGESNWNIHKEIRNISEGDIVMIDAFECNERALLGELVSKYILLYRQASALVVNGTVRDVPNLIKDNYPIWCNGYNPEGCFNIEKYVDINRETHDMYKDKYHNAIAVCDDCGVVVIPKNLHNQKFLDKIVAIEEQEDIWFDCLDHKHWDTYRIVCKKEYKNGT